MGHRMVKTITKSLFICFFQTFVVLLFVILSLGINFPIIILLIPTINFFIAYYTIKGMRNYKKILFYSLMVATIFFLIFLIYMVINGSFLGALLIVMLFFYGFLLSDLLCFVVKHIQIKKHSEEKKTGDGSLSKDRNTGDGSPVSSTS